MATHTEGDIEFALEAFAEAAAAVGLPASVPAAGGAS
jgi:hypothetical protein